MGSWPDDKGEAVKLPPEKEPGRWYCGKPCSGVDNGILFGYRHLDIEDETDPKCPLCKTSAFDLDSDPDVLERSCLCGEEDLQDGESGRKSSCGECGDYWGRPITLGDMEASSAHCIVAVRKASVARRKPSRKKMPPRDFVADAESMLEHGAQFVDAGTVRGLLRALAGKR